MQQRHDPAEAARAPVGDSLLGDSRLALESLLDLLQPGSCIPSFRFSYIEAKGLRGRLGVDAKAQANLPDV